MRWENKTLSECSPAEALEFAKLRTDIYFLEQSITEEEIDQWDFHPRTRHMWVRDEDEMVGYVRVVHADTAPAEDRGVTTSIGRLVVHADYRGRGLARGLVERAIAAAGAGPIVLHAQTYIQPLYASVGFEPFGEVFDEAGIEHIRMLRPEQ